MGSAHARDKHERERRYFCIQESFQGSHLYRIPALVQEAAQRRVIVFYHIAAMNSWREVVEGQLSRLVFSGLYDRADTVFCGITAPSQTILVEAIRLVTGFGAKIKVLEQVVNSTEYERLTLHRIRENTVATDAILYFHSKGVSSKPQGQKRKAEKSHWRFIMEYWLMGKHALCIEALDTFDVVGVASFFI